MYGYRTLKDFNSARLATFMKTYKIEDNEAILKTKSNSERSALPPYVVSCFAAHSNYNYSPIDYGWQEEDGKYIFKWFDGEQLPDLQDITDDLSKNLTEDADGDEESSDYDDDDDDESSTEESDIQSDSETH
ncbi:unnamed protein product [Ceutorhynchus assimilis]|uniref:Uncharacterized protein n=1 Tax=Ceutorhynchus assimilis TaxID=467358 RepID=A0A9N9MD24_9CUCU|nr:unnamed protein product [Ceutorhynchus assimilis]